MEKASKENLVKKMSDEEFLSALDEFIIKRKVTGKSGRKSKPMYELSPDKKRELCKLRDTESLEESCKILKPLYDDCKKKLSEKSMSIHILGGIYFVIMRECIMAEANGESFENDGYLRKNITVGRTGEVYKALGKSNSKMQERYGIRPLRDYTMLTFEPVNFNSRRERGKITREVILSLLMQYDYATMLDLTGEVTIFEDLYYSRTEILNCTNSVVANFYQTLKYRYPAFKKEFAKQISKLPNGIKTARNEYAKKLREAQKEHIESPSKIKTYPYSRDEIDPELAVSYLIDKLLNENDSISSLMKKYEKLPEEVEWLKCRLNKVSISWDRIEDLLKKIQDSDMDSVVLLPKKADTRKIVKKAFVNLDEDREKAWERKLEIIKNSTDFKDIKKEEKRQEFIAIARKKFLSNTEKARLKRGVIFYDYNIQNDEHSFFAFKNFVAKCDCYWIFVCDKRYEGIIAEIKKYCKTAIRMSFDDKTNFYTDGASENQVVISNIIFNGLLSDKILKHMGVKVSKEIYGITYENVEELFEIERF